jgi:hypothetical protein
MGSRGFHAAKSSTSEDRALEKLAARLDLKRQNEQRRDAGRVSPGSAKGLPENCFPSAFYIRGSALPLAAMNAPRANCVKATGM